MAAAARFSRGQASTASKLSHYYCIVVVRARCEIATSLHQTHQIPACTIQNAPNSDSAWPENRNRARAHQVLPAAPAAANWPCGQSDQCDCGTRNQKAPGGSAQRPWPLPKVTMHHRVSLGQNELSARNHAHRRFSRPSKAPAT